MAEDEEGSPFNVLATDTVLLKTACTALDGSTAEKINKILSYIFFFFLTIKILLSKLPTKLANENMKHKMRNQWCN